MLQQRDKPSKTPSGHLPKFAVSHRFRLWLVFLFLFHLAAPVGFAQVSKEYQLKAVFLWRLAQFTQWPSSAFDAIDSPIVICVLGENPFGEALDAAVRGETAHRRNLIVQRHRSVQDIESCHVLYVTASAARQVKEIGGAIAGRSILTVRDAETSGRVYDTIVRFVTEGNRIRLAVNPKAAAAARLVLDARLLRAAEIIGTE